MRGKGPYGKPSEDQVTTERAKRMEAMGFHKISKRR